MINELLAALANCADALEDVDGLNWCGTVAAANARKQLIAARLVIVRTEEQLVADGIASAARQRDLFDAARWRFIAKATIDASSAESLAFDEAIEELTAVSQENFEKIVDECILKGKK
jgi:hypothetical protein